MSEGVDIPHIVIAPDRVSDVNGSRQSYQRLAPCTTPPTISWAVDLEERQDIPSPSLGDKSIDEVDLPGHLQEDSASQGLRSSLKTSEAWNKPMVAFAEPGLQNDEPGGLSFSMEVEKSTQSSHRPRPSKETASSMGSSMPCQSLCCCLSKGSARLLRRRLRPFVQHRAFQAMLIVSLFFALFGNNLWILLEVPDDPGIAILDVLMTTILVIFILEMVLLSITEHRTYIWSFFFWMDLLGSASMIFEISYLLGTQNELTQSDREVDTTLLRTARATKVGARVGRLTKLTKFIKWMSAWAGQRYEESTQKNKQQTAIEHASAVSREVMLHLSVKVALLSIVLIMIIPLFSMGDYPQDDWSLRTWSQRIEKEYARLHNLMLTDPAMEFAIASEAFLSVLESANDFYHDVSWFPFKVEGYSDEFNIMGRIGQLYSGPNVFHSSTPKLNQFIIRQEVPSCLLERPSCSAASGTRAAVFYNRREPSRLQAGMDMLMIVFILVVMLGITFDLSRTIHRMLMTPLERMLSLVKARAQAIFDTVVAMETVKSGHVNPDGPDETDSGDSVDVTAAAMSELEMLEQALEKLAVIGNLLVLDEVVDEATMANLDHEGKGIITEILRMGPSRSPSVALPDTGAQKEHDNTSDSEARLPVSVSLLQSWDFDVLPLSHSEAAAVLEWTLFDSKVGERTGKALAERSIFERFIKVVEAGYEDQPYHNFKHACDVCHTVSRLLSEVQSDTWLSVFEQYALLVAAICHDIGHPGKTNVFLVQTRDPLAMLYNDQSPLENMHCARLFAIGLEPKTNLFQSLSKDAYKEVRKVCISAILHTDNAHHFQMVKDITRVYEMATELCESQAETAQQFTSKYLAEVLKKDSVLWLKLFLHLADVSNPLKPFPVCKAWAWRVLDEFFAQGDAEKSLGLPVGMLNDRDKTNRPGSQHGFINFLVAPLVQGSVRIFPTLHPLFTQMARNLADWQGLWEEDVHPSAEDVAKRTADVQKVQEMAARLALYSNTDGTTYRMSTQSERSG
mmetsp:Transcript_75554/g.179505  ORF Transcript_75554/g.179505 Transcript_75554/m.179505 type:complete len:1020 (-) Transcript_75554:34-3093(-)